ncbi:MAG TPA: cation diffusion facilitator family transporter [Candidatus Tyrphobacter sp.]
MAHLVRNGRLFGALVVSLVVAVVEIAGGIRAGSLGLIADAVHAGTDAIAVMLALAASFVAMRPANRRKTYGYGRMEVLGAVLNGGLLLGVTAVIAFSAVQRIAHPVHPQGEIMATVSAIALVGNITAGILLVRGAGSSLNMRAAFLHVTGDALGSSAVLAGGLLIVVSHRAWIDPALTLFVCAIVVAGVLHMLREAADVLLEAAPRGVDVGEVERAIEALPEVADVHDLHVWTIGSGEHALSTHLVLAEGRSAEASAVLQTVRSLARGRFGVTHVTLQVEAEHCDPEGKVVCVPLEEAQGP